MSNSTPPNQPPTQQSPSTILGLSTAELAGLSVDEVVGNKVAVTMVLHYYRQLSEENSALRNDLNTARTYVQGYDRKRTHAAIGAILLTLSNLGIGFGVNILTTAMSVAGFATLVPGIGLAAAGLYFSLRDRN